MSKVKIRELVMSEVKIRELRIEDDSISYS